MKLKSIAIVSVLLFFILGGFIYLDLIYDEYEIYSTNVVLNDSLRGKQIDELVIQYAKGDTLWGSRGYTLYKSVDKGETFFKLFRIPIPFFSLSYLGNSNLLRKHFRLYDIAELVILDSDTYLLFAGGNIYRSDNTGDYIRIVEKLRIYGMGEGRGVMPQGITQDFEGNVYYGEYGNNVERDRINIYKGSNNGLSWETFYTFPRGKIRHIHAVQFDKFTNKIWIATGDLNNECIIGFIDLETNLFSEVASGAQDFRAVSLLFDEDFVYWGMDSPAIENFIYKYDRKTQEITKVTSIKNPAYYSYEMSNGIKILGTVVENRNQVGSTDVEIWRSFDGEVWNSIFETKGSFEGRGHSYSRFPRGSTDDLIFSLFNTVDYNNSLFVIDYFD